MKNKLLKLDWFLITLIIMLITIGLFAINSTTNSIGNNYLHKQMTYIAIFFPIMLIIALIDIKIWHKYTYLFYFIGVTLLIATYFFGYKAMGATRWLRIGSFNIQPSEFMKIIMLK